MKTRIALVLILCSALPASLALAAHASKAALSHNWSGYAAEGGGYSAVSGSWVMPSIGTEVAESASAEWIGIGGMQGKDLIQAGTRAKSEGGAVSYEAWYELYPAPAVAVPVSVRAGDTVSASVAQSADGAWNIALTDTTTGASYATTTAYASLGASAEWVVEAPGTAAGGLLALDRFSPIAFIGAEATKRGVPESPADLGAAGLSLVNASGAVLAVPSPLSAAGTGFTVTRTGR